MYDWQSLPLRYLLAHRWRRREPLTSGEPGHRNDKMRSSAALSPHSPQRHEFRPFRATAAGTFLSIGLSTLQQHRHGASQRRASRLHLVTLTPDGKVTMHIVKAEMGQHVGTGLAQVIAEES